MSTSRRPETRLGPGIAAVLRAGTIVAVSAVAAGWLIALAGGGAGPGALPIGDLVTSSGGDAVASIGLLALTLLPFAVLARAAAAFAADGERRYLIASIVTIALLAGSLVVSALVAAS